MIHTALLQWQRQIAGKSQSDDVIRDDGWLCCRIADAARICARAWLLDTVIAVDSHPHLVNTNSGEISHACVRNIFESRKTLIEYTWKGVDFISFSIPRNMENLRPRNAVPMVAIIHGTRDISQHTVQSMFCRVEGF